MLRAIGIILCTGMSALLRFSVIGAVFILALNAADNDSGSGFKQLRFSPDGRRVLAQDDGSITVLSVDPFSILFRIPAPRADSARFTPDSEKIVFLSTHEGLHVERWSVSNRKLDASIQLPLLVCGTLQLSPDGAVLACVDSDYKYYDDFRLIDVHSGKTVFYKKRLAMLFANYGLGPGDLPTSYWGALGYADIDFSPDAR